MDFFVEIGLFLEIFLCFSHGPLYFPAVGAPQTDQHTEWIAAYFVFNISILCEIINFCLEFFLICMKVIFHKLGSLVRLSLIWGTCTPGVQKQFLRCTRGLGYPKIFYFLALSFLMTYLCLFSFITLSFMIVFHSVIRRSFITFPADILIFTLLEYK